MKFNHRYQITTVLHADEITALNKLNRRFNVMCSEPIRFLVTNAMHKLTVSRDIQQLTEWDDCASGVI